MAKKNNCFCIKKNTVGWILVSPVAILFLGMFLYPLYEGVTKGDWKPAILCYSVTALILSALYGLTLLEE